MALMIHQNARQRLGALDRNSAGFRRELEQLLDIYPDFAPALGCLAEIHEATGDFSAAARLWESAAKVEPLDAEYAVRFARLHYEKMSGAEAAVRMLKRVLELQPGHQEVHLLLSKIRRSLGVAFAGEEQGTPLVSAIVSAYKSTRYLRGCLEDLENQTIADRLEIIVVDSNSPEDERAIVEEFQQRYTNIVYIRSAERETVYGAWNRGIKAARGKYVTNANTDDRHRADALERLAWTLEQNPGITLAYADCLITRVENETFAATNATRKYQWLEFNAGDLLLKGCFCGPQPMWRREVHDEHGFFDAEFVSAGDYEFWLRIARTRKFLHVKEVLGLYLESPTSVEHANTRHGIWEVRESQRRYGADILPGFKVENLPGPVPERPPVAAHARKSIGPARPAVVPAVAKIGQLKEAGELLLQKNIAPAWAAATRAIKQRPFHPEAYLLLAEIALEAGDAISARACAQHARSLAPGWPAVRQFLSRPIKGNARPDWLQLPAALQEGGSKMPNLSVCLIVRNEEKFLAQCLKSVRPVARQIVVIDTGSTDRTVGIAREFGAEVHAFEWCDNFAAARNAALEHATGDWVLILDADEELLEGQHQNLLADLGHGGAIAVRLPLINRGLEAEGRNFVPRLFRNAPGIFFTGRIHEQFFPSLAANARLWGLKSILGTAELLHHGYTKEIVRDRNKVARNLKLLQDAVTEQPADANLMMNFGLELVRSGDLAGGVAKYREAYELMSAQTPEEVAPELREVMLTQFVCQLYKLAGHHEIVRVLNSPLARHGGLTASLHFAAGLALFELKKFTEAAEHMRQCLARRKLPALSPANPDVFTSAPNHCLVLCLAKAGDVEGAETAFGAALKESGREEDVKLDYAKFLAERNRQLDALKVLHALVSANSRNAAAWRLGGEIALGRPEFLAFARDWTGEAVRYSGDDAAVVAQRAEALMLSGDLSGAAEFWERAWNSGAEPARLAALILCQLVGAPSTHAPKNDREEALVSREFIVWYRKLLTMRAQKTIVQLNEQTEKLSRALPGAAKVLEATIAEMERCT